jgi:hypothetical protein
MKRLFLTTLVMLTLLALPTGIAFAGSALELVHVDNNGGGPTFTFRVVGEFSDDELAGGFVQVQGGDDFPLYCSQTTPDTVVCHTSKAVGGHDVVVGFGGARFWTYVKEQHIHTSSFCYPVYDANTAFPIVPSVSPGFVFWREECSENQPVDGIFPVGPSYSFGAAPSGWGSTFYFFSNDIDPAYPPIFEFITPGYYSVGTP